MGLYRFGRAVAAISREVAGGQARLRQRAALLSGYERAPAISGHGERRRRSAARRRSSSARRSAATWRRSRPQAAIDVEDERAHFNARYPSLTSRTAPAVAGGAY